MKLQDIGFYTLSNKRAREASHKSPLRRCELIVTPSCNLKCTYCRTLPKKANVELTFNDSITILDKWIRQGLRNIRFSGGEPTLWQSLIQCVNICKKRGVERIAISTNGTANLELYEQLIWAGVNDISISLDSACCSTGSKCNGGFQEAWKQSLEIITAVSQLTYVTIGVVLNENNSKDLQDTISWICNTGVDDIRIIPAAQHDSFLPNFRLSNKILKRFPILSYRYHNLQNRVPVRGLTNDDSLTCYLALDDMVVAGEHHWPCIIYLREGGAPIGKFGKNFRQHRRRWAEHHNPLLDPICKKNCLDICRDYNNKAHHLHQ